MLIQIPEILTPDQLQRGRALLQAADWADGAITAGRQSAQVKHNLQLPETAAQLPELRRIVLDGLARSALFFSAALPRNILPPLFNCYTGDSNFFGKHVDNAVRSPAGSAEQVRTDLSATLFFCDPDEYDGGELVIEDTFGTQRVKLPAGHLVLYPSSSLHRVEPVTRGARLASFLWMQSLVREAERRRLLFEMDMALLGLRQQQSGAGDSPEVVRLTACYHNLLRMWAEV
jgi:PKHD-type hydroxylase